MSENPENTNKTKSETVRFHGFPAQINLSPGSETHRRFGEYGYKAGATSNRQIVEMLLDACENPHVDTDNSEVIANLEQQLNDLKAENAAYEATQQNNEAEIAQLKLDLAAARKEANENAAHVMQIEADNANCIILKPNIVSAYFLAEMSQKTGKTPGKILERLFIDDLQNPRANNLPYTVESSRIREVMKELKNNQNQ